MSVLRSIESKIEGLFEGVFGRAFRTHVQPVELARKLAKEMDEHRSVSVSRVYVPNEYTVYLAPGDRQQFASYEGSLIGELQEYLGEHARREAYALLTPPTVVFTSDDDLAIGEFGIATRVVQREAPAARGTAGPGAAPEPAATMIYRPREPLSEDGPPTEPVEVEREVVSLTIDGHTYPVTSRKVVLGRSRECDIRVADANVSRRHAELRQEGATHWIVDLDSTNGTQVNGRRVDRAKLTDGDRVTIGDTDVLFARSLP